MSLLDDVAKGMGEAVLEDRQRLQRNHVISEKTIRHNQSLRQTSI